MDVATSACRYDERWSIVTSGPGLDATIDRDAASSAKGPRLQRLRAVLFLLQSVTDEKNVQVYVAVEAAGDVFVGTASTTDSSHYSEEDKNYDEEGAFTFVSGSVLNTIVIFLDQWIGWKFSTKLRFGFYTPVQIGKEKQAGRVKTLGLTLPAKPILEQLRAHDYSDPQLLPCVKALALAEYRAQYEKAKKPGYADVISDWDDETWKDFLSRIAWLTSSGDEEECSADVHAAIKKCPCYTEAHEGKEDIIEAVLLDVFDERQLLADYAERFVHGAEVELVFKRVELGDARRVDPTWKAWESLSPPTDQRNIGEKFTAACPGIGATALGTYQRKTAAGLLELDAQATDKSLLALRYQVYDACADAIEELAIGAAGMSELELKQEIDRLTNVAIARIAQRSADYQYSIKSDVLVRNIVLTLFDSCYLTLRRDGNG